MILIPTIVESVTITVEQLSDRKWSDHVSLEELTKLLDCISESSRTRVSRTFLTCICKRNAPTLNQLDSQSFTLFHNSDLRFTKNKWAYKHIILETDEDYYNGYGNGNDYEDNGSQYYYEEEYEGRENLNGENGNGKHKLF